jgi:hypothetical protein
MGENKTHPKRNHGGETMNRVSSILSILFFSVLLIVMAPATAGVVQPMVVSQARLFVIEDQAPNQEKVQVFAGTIVSKDGGMFFLEDDTKYTVYALDNQALAAKFADKKVLVTGTLDKKGTIHIKNIEEQKA